MIVTLIKLSTLDEAEFPQEDKYPSGRTVRKGYIKAEHMPQVGKAVYISNEHNIPIFHTSTVRDVEEVDNHTMILTTLNSKYRLEYERQESDFKHLINNEE